MHYKKTDPVNVMLRIQAETFRLRAWADNEGTPEQQRVVEKFCVAVGFVMDKVKSLPAVITTAPPAR